MITTYICNACGGGVSFVNKKPVNEDGSPHWDVCKERQFEKVRRLGNPYRTENESGYIHKGERLPMWKRGPQIIGAMFIEDGCQCGIPPWELCSEVCEHKI